MSPIIDCDFKIIEEEEEPDNTYHKNIDALIEDAEIEAEIDAEKKVRSKNARLFTISLFGIALIVFVYLQVSGTTFTQKTSEVALPELAEVQPANEITGVESDSAPLAEPAQLSKPAPLTESAPLSEPTPVVAEEPEPPAKSTANVEPEVAKVAEIAKVVAPVAPIEKKEEPVVAKALLKELTPQKIAKAVVQQPAKIQAPVVPAVKKYFVQLGTFSIEGNAKGFTKQLKAKGFPASTLVRSGRARKHIVFVGGFPSIDSGRQALNDLKSKGFNSTMEKLDDNSYTIVLGKFSSSRQAEALRDKLSFEGFLSSTRVNKVSSPIYIVQLGGFDGLRQAKVMQKKVGRAGFNDSFIR